MVFRQLGDDTDIFIKNFGLQIGQFKKTIKDIGKDFNSGLGLRSLTGFITKKDISALNNYAQAIQNGTNYTEAFETHLSKVPVIIKKQANELVKLVNQQKLLNKQHQEGKITQQEYDAQITANKTQMQAIITQTEKLTLAQKASAVASKATGVALNMAFNMGIALVISGIISYISGLVNSQKELAEKAKEAAKSLKEEKESIEEYKNKITELKNALADETISEEDAYNARKQLLEIQDEIVTKYGLQKKSIDLVNGSLREEIALLDEVSQKESQAFLRENKKAIDNTKKKVEKETSLYSSIKIVNI